MKERGAADRGAIGETVTAVVMETKGRRAGVGRGEDKRGGA